MMDAKFFPDSWSLEAREQEKQDLINKLRNNEQLSPEEKNKLADLLESKDTVEKTEEEIKEEENIKQELKKEHEDAKNEQNDQVDTLKEKLWESTASLPDEIRDFQQARESTINLDDATKKEMIALRDKLLQDGTLTYQNHPEWWIITSFNGLDWVENPRFYDATKILKPALEKDGILHEGESTAYWQKISIWAKLKGLWWDIDKWSAKNTAHAIKEQEAKYWLKMHSDYDMFKLFKEINTKSGSSLNEFAFWSLCTGCKWSYRLFDNYGSSRTYLLSKENFRLFFQNGDGNSPAGILL